ncbi:hypothetical protein [Nocardia jejuensis]|uniref:hypothetical protein n=1 Tax=Nocardia jejuensis TaxID=328049 RepID=UPI00083457B7|nr:hypothetical protein [Nocardia jejuensis]
MNDLAVRLDQLRGSVPPVRHNARTIAALTANPGCARRAILDAAAIDKTTVARELGFPSQFGQSQFAITRGNEFERMVKANGCAELIALLRDKLGLSIPEVALSDLSEVGDNSSTTLRYQRTRQLLARALESGEGTMFDHPMLRIDIAGAAAYLEPDVVAIQLAGQFYVVEIKSFAVIDGQADPTQVAAAARQSAVYVLALRQMVCELGGSGDDVSHNAILVCAKDFTNRPTAELVDLRKQLGVIERQLSRMTSISSLLETLPEELTFEPGEGLGEAIADLPARYAPECMSSCELAFLCREQARACGSLDVLGRGVCDQLGGIERVDLVLGLARGTVTAGPEFADIAQILRRAHALSEELAG